MEEVKAFADPFVAHPGHGYSGKHGSKRVRALVVKKRLLSVRRKQRFFPTRGMVIPTTPTIRIDVMAMSLRSSAASLTRSFGHGF